jgi:hypothetical protein
MRHPPGVRIEREACLWAGGHYSLDQSLPEQAGPAKRAPATVAGVGGKPSALWISPSDRAVRKRRAHGERKTSVPVVSRRRFTGAHETTYATSGAAPCAAGWSKASEPALEHGFCKRPIGGRALVPHSDSGGSIHAGMPMCTSRSATNRREGNRTNGTTSDTARKTRIDHHG